MRLFPNHDRPPVDGGGVALWPGRQAEAPPGGYPPGPAAAKGRAQPRRRALRYPAAAAIAVGGYIHLCLYRNGFRAIPKIGTGFLLQVVTSALLAGGLLIGRERILQVGRFLVRSAVAVRALGLSLSLGTLVAFGLTRTPMGLFNFTERGLQPAPQALIALVAELAAAALLTTTLVLDHLWPVSVQLAGISRFSDVPHGPVDQGPPNGAPLSSSRQPSAAPGKGLVERVARRAGPGRRRVLIAGAVALAILIGTVAYGATVRSKPKAAGLGSIQHIVVVYMENWSFDSLYGKFPGANGIASATGAQVDRNGAPYITLAQPLNSTKAEQPAGGSPAPPNPPDPRFPANLPNTPFDIASYVPPTDNTGDLGAGFYQE